MKKKRVPKFYMVETKVFDDRGEMIAMSSSYIPAELPVLPEDRWWRKESVRRVKSVEDLKKIKPRKGQTIEVLGYYGKGPDGDGGNYVPHAGGGLAYRAAPRERARFPDNGGSLIVPPKVGRA